ncbi:MAG: nucleoside-diphosphate sugar epimerase/dehydratase [Clostridia bacterium]|nr:nucleoside-diphosphate sugar epimerase/dehydratase [Clostridia bacterium]MDD4375343.1 nucleoside-diphosphate sugar epimerase/dehydratase [Clostridia bacterium]
MLVKKIKNNTTYRRIGIAIIDAFFVVIGYFATFLFTDNVEKIVSNAFINTVIVAVIVYIAVFYLLKVYKSITKYSGVRDYVVIGFCCIISSSLLSTFNQLSNIVIYGIKRSILAAFITGFCCVAYRVLIRSILDGTIRLRRSKKKKEKILIIGGGSVAARVIKNVFSSIKEEYKIIGIIDDNESKIKCCINGVEILGDRNKIIETCEKNKIDLILFSIAKIDAENQKEILNICSRTKAKIKIIPNIEEIIKNDIPIKLSEFKDVEIEDLLGRQPIKLDDNDISKFIKQKTVLVTGGGGSIGSELCRQIASFEPKKLVMVDIYENALYEIERELRKKYPQLQLETIISSVRDKRRINEIFEMYIPEIVFHTAAHKHVPLMETVPGEAIKNNVFGTLNVANASVKNNVKKFILISTDKAVNPTSIMGATKRICEMIIQAKNTESSTEFVAVRFGNVLGSNGSVIPIFKNQIKEGGPITVTHKDITRYFMTISEAVGLILQAITFASGGEIFVLDMGEPVKIYDLAENLIRLAGHEPNVDIKIELTGLRPGEKLYEELLVSEEGLVKTMHEKIMVSRIMDFDKKSLEIGLKNLKGLVNTTSTKKEYIRAVKKIVPSFIELSETTKKSNDNNKSNNVKKLGYIINVNEKNNKIENRKVGNL